MIGPINRVVRGWLGFADLQQQGRNLNFVADELRATIDYVPFLTQQGEYIEDNAIAGVQICGNYPSALVVPQGEMWAVVNAFAGVALPVGGGAISGALTIFNPVNNDYYKLGDQIFCTPGAALAAQWRSSYLGLNKPVFLDSGWGLSFLLTESSIAAPLIGVVRGRILRFKV